jgi:hypothetical protein
VVTAAGFFASAHDLTLFVHMSPRGRTLLLFYVDNMIITGVDPEYNAFVKARLSDQFLMSDLGPLSYFLGIEISSAPEGFFLSQEKYIQDLLLLITVRLRLPWSSIFTLHPLMVSFLRILLVIVTL